MKRLVNGVLSTLAYGLRNSLVAIGALALAGGVIALANYAVTVGAGTTFGSIVVAAVHYAQQLVCDPTTPSQCAAVSAGGAVATSSLAVNATAATWTSVTAANTNVDLTNSGNYPSVLVTVDYGTTSAGAITFRGKKANGSYETIPIAQVLNKSTCASLTNAYSLLTGGQTGASAQDFLLLTNGYSTLNADLTSQATGLSGNLVVTYTLLPYNAVLNCLPNPLSGPNTAIIGKVTIDQTTDGTTNKTASFNATGQYETVAASVTGQALGPTGGTGDYLSHCTVYPTSTSPGVVTVFDNTSSATNNVIAFAGGSSSITNLVPFTFPVGAYSVNGAWKVTTGANLVVTCYGKFT